MLSVQRHVELSTAHRLMFHKGKCHCLHGHSYKFVIEVSTPSGSLSEDKEAGASDTDMLVDFTELKAALDSLKDSYDHKTILHEADQRTTSLSSEELVMVTFQPTAERLVMLFSDHVMAWLPECRLIKATLWETSKCCAIYRP